MADRVNKKFALILATALIGLTAGLFGAWYFMVHVRGNPQKLMQQGDGFMAQGMVEKAIEQYGKAIRKKSNDLPLIFKYVDALEKIQTDETLSAQNYIRQIGGALTQANTQEPNNQEAFQRLMSFYMRIGRDLNDFNQWNRMHELTDSRIKSGYDTPLIRKYRGISQVFRMEGLNLTDDQRQQAFEDLTIARDNFPEERDSTYYLAAWHMMQAKHLKRTGTPAEQVQIHRDAAGELLANMIELNPDKTRLAVDQLRIIGMRSDPEQDEIKAMIASVEERLIADPSDPKLVLEASQIMPLLDRKHVQADDQYPTSTISGLRRSERLLRAAIEANEDNPHLMFALGEVLRRQRRSNEGMPLFLKVYETLTITDAFEALILDRLKIQAKIRYADLLLDTAKRQKTTEDKDKVLDQVRSLIDEVAAEYGDNGQVNLVQGKLALIERQWSLALTKLDQANSAFKDTNPEALLLSAQVRAQLGELGAATQRLERLIEVRPDFLPARYDLTNNYLKFGELVKAEKQIEIIRSSDPDDHWGIYYQARLFTRTGKVDEAIRLYESISSLDIPDLPVRLARLHIAKGSPELGKSTLKKHFNENPTDSVALQLLVQLSTDSSEAKAYIDAARQAGVSEKAMDLLEQQIEGSINVEELVDNITERNDTPIGQHLTRYRLYRQLGQIDKAQAELESAEKVDPNHPVVISALFGQSISSKDWDTAQSLADRAAAFNLDEAQGMFYYGRLELERDGYERAINTLRRGLKLRPVYSEGWRLLGDALRQSSDLEGATDAYQRSVTQRPNNTYSLSGLAKVYDLQGKRTEALLSWRKAVQFSPRDRALRAEYLQYEQEYGEQKRALVMRQRTAQVDPEDTGNRRALALLLVALERSDEALRLLDDLTEETGNNRLNVSTRAQIYTAQGKTDQATNVIKEYVYQLEDKATAVDWLMLARHLNNVGQQDNASAAYRQAISLEEEQTRVATREYADILFDRQMSEESLPHYEVLWKDYPNERRVGLRYAEALLRANNLELASTILAKVNSEHEPDGTSLILEAIILRSLTKIEQAGELLNIALELEPLNAMIYFRRGQLYATEPNMESQVISDLRRAIELSPDMIAARELLASLHLRRGERNEAVRELETIIKRNPDRTSTRLRLADIYREEGDTVLLRGLLKDSEESFPKMAIWPQLRGKLEYSEGNITLGIEKLQESFYLSPSAQLLGELVQVLIETDRTDTALDMLRTNSQAVSQVPYLQALRGQALVVIGQKESSEAVFAGAIDQCKEFEDLSSVLGVMANAVGESRSIAILNPMAKGSRRGLIELAMAQVEISALQFDEAMDRLARIETFLRSGSHERVIYDRLVAVSLQQLDRPEQALESYNRVLEAEPNDLITLNNTAYLLVEQLDRPDEAVRMAHRAATIAPNNPLVLDTLGWSLFKIGETERALQVLQRSVKLNRTGTNCFHFAEVLLKNGDTSSSIDMFKHAVNIAEKENDQDTLLSAETRLQELTQ